MTPPSWCCCCWWRLCLAPAGLYMAGVCKWKVYARTEGSLRRHRQKSPTSGVEKWHFECLNLKLEITWVRPISPKKWCTILYMGGVCKWAVYAQRRGQLEAPAGKKVGRGWVLLRKLSLYHPTASTSWQGGAVSTPSSTSKSCLYYSEVHAENNSDEKHGSILIGPWDRTRILGLSTNLS